MTNESYKQKKPSAGSTPTRRPSVKATAKKKRADSSAKRPDVKAKGGSGAKREKPRSSQKETTATSLRKASGSNSRNAAELTGGRRSKKSKATQSNASKRSASRMANQPAPSQTGAIDVSSIGDGAATVARGVGGVLGAIARAIASNRASLIAAIIVIVLVIAGVFDTAANWNKAFGNVSVNGIDVSGMTADEIEFTLRANLTKTVAQSHVKIYASEEAQTLASQELSDEERLAHIEQVAQAEQISVEEATDLVTSWSTDALSLKATIPYEDLAAQAIAVGREDGGILSRLGLIFMNHDVKVELSYDEEALESLATGIDRTIGDERVDATVEIEEGVASPVEGHDGRAVDREWFASQLSAALVSGDENPSFVAQVSDSPSRITFEQAQEASDGINHALALGAVFTYKGAEWDAYGYDIGYWTRVKTVSDGNGGYKLDVHIDESAAIPAVVKGAGAAVRSENVTVKFAKADDGSVVVRTFGPGNIPEVAPAIEQLDEALYGQGGTAWNYSANEPVRIEILESDAPSALTLDQAIELGIVTSIGEYTTEFSDSEGTENRNHNIKLAADILNNSIVEADGGTWHFNDRTGDTNEEAGFWAAGSIVEGEYVDSIGGGICQVATTVFNAVYEAGLPIDMRFPHQLYIESYPSGRDAAVSYPDLDLWWTNDLSSDVLLVLSYTDTSLTARLYSVYTGYTVESIEGEWAEGAKYKTVFEEDPTLEKGDYYVKTTGVDGSSISVTRIVKNEAGEVISDQVFDSLYDPKDEVIVVGPGTDTSKLGRTDSSNDDKRSEDGSDED